MNGADSFARGRWKGQSGAARSRTSQGFPQVGLRPGAGRSKMYITFTYPWTGRGPGHILKAAHTLNPVLLITGAFAPGLAKR